MAAHFIRGLDILRARVPELRKWTGLARIAALIVGVFSLTTLFFIAVDRRFSEWMPDGEIVVMALGFLILSRFFS
jgi:hypothetical protein